MQYSDAFSKLGYTLEVPRQDWSAENRSGVCLSLWKVELGDRGRRFDTRVHAQPYEGWASKPGNTKRKRHIARALAEFDGYVDVVIVHGQPGEGYGMASPWLPEERRGARWRVTDFDPETGHLCVELEEQETSN